ncbi:hypothetical protein AVEN_139825-1 [Araneus ventricosus]|uniref:Uncharacterized protein n=1 Tax=Araneus ventricosus TaxID=182803 RepID=A0A4Y2MJR9_ARAVE|nr:hypothetical protein AVEN_139825-1 [Araneus ventricosus]
MMRTSPELAPFSPNFRATQSPYVLLPGLTPDWVGQGAEWVSCNTPAGGRLTITYDLTCNWPHARWIFSVIGFRSWNLPAPSPRPYL